MSYKRFISYLYQYEMGERVHNVGFARVELSNDLCRITASCTTRVISQKECHVYFIQSKKGTISGIEVEKLPVKEGELNLKILMEDGLVPGSELPFADMTGILFYFTRDNYIGAYWDNSTILYKDIPDIIEKKEIPVKKEEISYVTVKEEEIEVIPDPIVFKEEEKKEPEPQKEVEPEPELEPQKEMEPEPEPEPESKPEFTVTALNAKEEEIEEQVEEQVEILKTQEEASLTEEMQEEMFQEEIQEEESQEEIPEEEEVRPEEETVSAMGCPRIDRMRFADHPGAREILTRFVRMYPFDDNEIPECVRLSIRDIGLLPMSAWVLGNNSFLQHGYYTFQHILFGKKMTKDGWSYLIMVPGAMNPREKQLASQFGFHNFKPSRRRCVRNGEFGYWYVPIDFNM